MASPDLAGNLVENTIGRFPLLITQNIRYDFRDSATSNRDSTVDLAGRLKGCLPRGLILDLDDHFRASALKAWHVVRDHSGLNKKRARRIEGVTRFQMLEQDFETVSALHGGVEISGVLPGSNLKIFQTFFRFGPHNGPGVVIGFAMMPESNKLPTQNITRRAGVTLNIHLSPAFDLDGRGMRDGDLFAAFLVARNPARAGHILQMAVGVIECTFEQFLFYETLDKFLSDEADAPDVGPANPPPSPAGVGSLRIRTATPYVPPEFGSEDEEKGGAI